MMTAYVAELCRFYGLKGKLAQVFHDARGVTALEYSVIAGVTVVAIGAALYGGNILTSITTIWGAIQTDLATGAAAA